MATSLTRSIKIEPIRELNYKISLRPVEAARRVAILVILRPANQAAANALKTLEEPPGDVIFILTANSLDTLLPTILSRCELFALRPLPLAQTQVALQSNWAALRSEAALLAHLAAGRLGWAVSVLQQPAILERRYSILPTCTTCSQRAWWHVLLLLKKLRLIARSYMKCLLIG